MRNFAGQSVANLAPSDQTGAIGTQRYVQLVNGRAAIFNRTSDTPIATSNLNTLVNAGSAPQVFDPQIMWDPGSNRFYYAADQVNSATDNRLAFGFSTTSAPNDLTTNWCKYVIGYGAEFPDYPKLGDLNGLLMIGANVFGPSTFIRSDVVGVTKPPGGTTCPAAGSFTASSKTNLTNNDGSFATTPVPVNQVDGSATGYIVAGRNFGGANFITVFNVTKNAMNQIVVGAPRKVSVPAYSIPAAAPQPGTARKLDTLDARLTNAVSAIDPFRSNMVAIWTQHTILGGAGSQVRWYEINPAPATPTLFQSGTQTNASLFLYNAAVSPDRRRNGAAGQFGDGMLLHYSRSSSSQETPSAVPYWIRPAGSRGRS